jgi:[acyl-carrier-protein] S-malonyltransferase
MDPNEIAFLFPGQGSQSTGMGHHMAEAFPEARAAFEEADAALGFSISSVCFEGPDERLRLTELTQPAILVTSIACLLPLRERGVAPAWVAGHSLGEYSALVCAGCLRLADAARLVSLRGRYMQEAVPVGHGAMAALLGLSPEQAEGLCRDEARGEVLSAANFNSPDQTVIAGTAAAVARAIEAAPARGAKRAIPLSVSAPFHCDLMAPARERLRPDLEAAHFSDLLCPLVTNVDARPLQRGDEARSSLIRQVTAPVRWEASIRELHRLGARIFVEVGPGKVLSGLVRRTLQDVKTLNVDNPVSLDRTVEAITKGNP